MLILLDQHQARGSLMRKAVILIPIFILQNILLISQCIAQKKGLKQIDKSDLETHLLFLASDEMEGRKTGEPGLHKAAEYLAEQAREIGLKPLDENGDFFQNLILLVN